MTKRYVEIPALRLQSMLGGISASVSEKGGRTFWNIQGREWVFDIHPHRGRGVVRVYTSLAKGETAVRACGRDACRIVLGVAQPVEGGSKFRPTAKARRILRTAPIDAPDRIGVFLDRLKAAIREAYGDAIRATPCPRCGSGVLALRRTKAGDRTFLGCSNFPECRHTATAA